MATSNVMKIQQTETEVAVLKVQVKNIEDKVDDLKDDIREVRDSINRNSEDHKLILKEMKDASATAHKSMSDKISALEKWRWMMMGAGIVLGSLGFDAISKLLK